MAPDHCPVCLDDHDPCTWLTMSCGHGVCKDCLMQIGETSLNKTLVQQKYAPSKCPLCRSDVSALVLETYPFLVPSLQIYITQFLDGMQITSGQDAVSVSNEFANEILPRWRETFPEVSDCICIGSVTVSLMTPDEIEDDGQGARSVGKMHDEWLPACLGPSDEYRSWLGEKFTPESETVQDIVGEIIARMNVIETTQELGRLREAVAPCCVSITNLVCSGFTKMTHKLGRAPSIIHCLGFVVHSFSEIEDEIEVFETDPVVKSVLSEKILFFTAVLIADRWLCPSNPHAEKKVKGFLGDYDRPDYGRMTVLRWLNSMEQSMFGSFMEGTLLVTNTRQTGQGV